MLVALGRLKDACLGPTSRVRHHHEREAPWADPLRIWNGYLWTGRVLAIGVRIAADQPERTEDGDRQLASVVDQLVLGDVVEQQRDALRVDEAAGRVGRQRHLAVAALHRQAAFHDRELALGG